MYYTIFEDNEHDDIQRLFKASYKDTKHLIWSQGSSNIEDEIKSHGVGAEYYVFMDLVPDNPETRKSYDKIKALKSKGYKVIIFPIPCAEYYLIKALVGIGLIDETDEIKEVINREVYYNSTAIIDERDAKHITNFERLCKVIVSRFDT